MRALTKLVVMGIGGLVLAVLILVVLVNPGLKRTHELNQISTEKKTKLSALEKQMKAYQTAQADLAQAVERQRITESLLTRETLEEAVISVESAASITQTEESKKITDEVENPEKNNEVRTPVVTSKIQIEEIPYRLSTKNHYIGVVNFIKYLENLPQFSEIEKITLSAELIESEIEDTSPIRTGLILGDIEALFFIRTEQ
jgi:hypothetical protein